MNKAIFLDRDGTINVEVNYLYKAEDLKLLPGVVDAIKKFNIMGYKVIVVTNQSGVARGYYKEEDVMKLHGQIQNILRENDAWIDAFYYCPHHIEGNLKDYAIDCLCRKPNPGLIIKAADEHQIDLSVSYIVGDKESDILAGINAGVGRSILVRCGHSIDEVNTQADEIFDSLYDFSVELVK